MKRLLLTAAATILIVGIATAQYKNTAPQPTQTTAPAPGPIQFTPAQTNTAAIADELSKARRITRAEAMRMVKQNKAVYVDVRSEDTWAAGHIPGALNIPLSQLMQRLKELPPGNFLITYCA
ncbi:MAG TPA: rhodanese-like domain-containing protein [Thermoanaerobaculia bacterium]